MGHRTLEPDDDEYHDLPDVLGLLRKEFKHVVETEPDLEGMQETVNWLEGRLAKNPPDRVE